MKMYLNLMFIILLIPSTVFAENMIFVTSGMSPPLVYENNGKLMGMDVEVIKEFCRQEGIKPVFKVFPWKRYLKTVKEGDAHGIFTLFKTEDREKFLYYPSEPINSVKTVVIAQKKNKFKMSKIDDLKNMTIGVMSGWKYGSEFDNLKGLKKTALKDKKQLISLLDNERLDVILNSEAVFYFHCKEYGFNPDKFEIIYLIKENPVYLGFSKVALKDKGIILSKNFNSFMKNLKEKGVLEEIRNKYQ